MKQTNNIMIGDIEHRVWLFEEQLHITGPDTPFPCEGGNFSPYAVSFRYVHTPDEGWCMGPSRLNGPRVLGEELGGEVEVRFDKDYMYSCPALGDGCPHEECPTPEWVHELAGKRMSMLPVPPVIS